MKLIFEGSPFYPHPVSNHDGPRVKARLHVDLQAMPHHTLFDAAEYLARRVADRAAAGDRAGIAFDMMSALTMCAFAVESLLQTIGSRVLGDDWPAAAKRHGKRQAVFAAIGIEPDMSARPFATLLSLQEVRNALAHGKPYRIQREWVSTGTHRELKAELRAAEAETDAPVSVEAVAYAIEDTQRVWETVLDAAGLDASSLLTGGSSGYSVIEYDCP